MHGTMLWFNEQKHHGIITTDDGEKIRVHRSAFVSAAPEGSCVGLPVEFEILEDADGRRAEAVKLVAPVAQRRARRRRSRF